MVEFLLILVFGTFFGVLRRWYGGYDFFGYKARRWLKTIIMMMTMIAEFYIAASLKHVEMTKEFWIISSVITVWLMIEYWSRAHGPAFDCARGTIITEEMIKRYNEFWYHHIPDFIFKKAKYGYGYDTMWLALRYTLPVLPLMLIDVNFFWVGFLVAPIYAYSWSLYDFDGQKVFPILGLKWIDYATNLGEVLTGFLFGAGLMSFALHNVEKLSGLNIW